MATGDLTAVIRPDGWSADVTIEGRAAWLGAAAYDFGTPGATGTSKFYLAVTSEGYNSSAVLGTIARTVYGTDVVRMPTGTYAIPGTLSGTFTDGEIVTQATTGATAVVYGAGQGTTHAALIVVGLTTVPASNSSDVWTGGTSGQTNTPSGAPASRTEDERVVGSDLVVRVSLSEQIHDDDKNGGAGTSGTDPTLTAASGWASSGGNNSNAAAAVTVTNNSTLDYPVAFGQWDFVGGQMTATRTKTAYRLAAFAWDGFGVACVRFNAVGGTSSVDTEEYVSKQTRVLRSGSSKYGWSYRSSEISLTPYTQGETITGRVRIYPKVGDANSVYDTNGNTTAADEINGHNEHKVICDKSNLLDVIRYVHSSSGNDSTGDGSSGNPWATIAKATTTAGVNVVKLKNAGPHNLGTSATRKTSSEWVVVEEDTGISATVVMTTTTTYRVERLCFRGVTVQPAGTTSYLSGENLNFVWFDSCVFDKNSVGNLSSAGPNYRSLGCYVTNCTGDLAVAAWAMGSASTSRCTWWLDGVAMAARGTANTIIPQCYQAVASNLGGHGFGQKGGTVDGPVQSGITIAYNLIADSTSASGNIMLMQAVSWTGLAIVGNAIEKTAGSGSCVHLWADGTQSTCTHVIVAHNTGQDTSSGARWNLFYNELGGTAYFHKHVFVVGNDIGVGNIKSDTFAPTNTSITRSGTTATLTQTGHGYATNDRITVTGATPSGYNGTFVCTVTGANTLTYVMASDPGASASPAGNMGACAARVGNWPQLYGVNFRSNNIDTNNGFPWEYHGVDYTSGTGTYVNAGTNDWTPDTGSVLLDRVSYATLARHAWGDYNGNCLSTDATALASVGALQPVPALTVTVDGNAASDGGTVDLGQQGAGGSVDMVCTVSGLTGAAVYIDDYSTDSGISEVSEFVPSVIAAGGSSDSNTASLRLEQGVETAQVTMTSTYGDGSFLVTLEWEEQSAGAVSALGDGGGWGKIIGQ